MTPAVPLVPFPATEWRQDLVDDEGWQHRIWTRHFEGKRDEGCDILLLLDGNSCFPLALQATQARSLERSLLLVGIGFPEMDRRAIVARRYRHLTSDAPPAAIPMPAPSQCFETGGWEAYLAFLTAHLLPEIERRYGPGNRTIFGHSLSGYFALRALLAGSRIANRIVVADPSVWWNGHELIDLAQRGDPDADPRNGFEELSLTVLIAGNKSPRSGLSEEVRARIDRLRGGPNGADLARYLLSHRRLSCQIETMPKETHGSIVGPAIALALNQATGSPS